MLTQLPTLAVVIIYLSAALLPALFLMRYIYRKDSIEKEPKGMLVGLVFLGVAAAVVAVIFETLGTNLLSNYLSADDPAYTIVLAFLVVAVVEEGAKYLFLVWRTWRDPNFNYRFDGIVYAVFVSLGFAAFENISYVMGYGLTTAVARALLAIPAHMGFAVFMGYFYGRAKRCNDVGNVRGFVSGCGVFTRVLRRVRAAWHAAFHACVCCVCDRDVYHRDPACEERISNGPTGLIELCNRFRRFKRRFFFFGAAADWKKQDCAR